MGRGAAPIVLGALLGRRLPITSGELRVDGLRAAVTIRRDCWGIPHVDASSDDDAWYALGFCEGQDRAFQLEGLIRVARGTLSALVGEAGLAADRLSRHIGFAHVARAETPLQSAAVRATLDAFARGVNAGRAVGLRRRPHELALLRGAPTPWTATDVVGVLKLQSFALSANWDVELARLHIVLADGADAMRDLDPAYASWQPVIVPPAATAPGVDAPAGSLSPLTGSGGSNNWVVAASRTASGRPILANDTHLAPSVPGPFYLAHLRTPEWSLAGAAFVGGPAFPVGHNGHSAWGAATLALADVTDLFVEEVGPDGASVREGDAFVPCEVRVERIEVKGRAPVEERVLVTRRGPIVGPALSGDVRSVSLRATWLDPAPVEGLLALQRVRSFDAFRGAFRRWRDVSLNAVYADVGGTIGYQMVGEVPRRPQEAPLPRDARSAGAGWLTGPMPFDDLPHAADPAAGVLVTANNRPASDRTDLGDDFIEGYRAARILERLAERRDWDLVSTSRLQLDVASIPWRELRGAVLDALAADPALAGARSLLEAWDGSVAADSSAAALFELLVADLSVRVARLRAPKSYPYALGRTFHVLNTDTTFAVRRVGHLVRALRERPEGWCGRPWNELIVDSARAALELLRARGRGGALPGWGELRALTIPHAFTGRRPIDRAFDLGPVVVGGDANTVWQAKVDPLAPTKNAGAIPVMRAVIDVGAWDDASFVLPGGQSGNPCSRNYDDQLELWRRGEMVKIAWSDDAVRAAARQTLRLLPT
ncbi:MAG: penicillin acylase family protein [Chloroflexota bacterium]|nr:penicillin acylase family protein [Chloroflexota bacterium]